MSAMLPKAGLPPLPPPCSVRTLAHVSFPTRHVSPHAGLPCLYRPPMSILASHVYTGLPCLYQLPMSLPASNFSACLPFSSWPPKFVVSSHFHTVFQCPCQPPMSILSSQAYVSLLYPTVLPNQCCPPPSNAVLPLSHCLPIPMPASHVHTVLPSLC